MAGVGVGVGSGVEVGRVVGVGRAVGVGLGVGGGIGVGVPGVTDAEIAPSSSPPPVPGNTPHAVANTVSAPRASQRRRRTGVRTSR